MGVQNAHRGKLHDAMLETARRYLQLADEGHAASPPRKEEIARELTRMLEPYSNNPAYTALLERKGLRGSEPL
jgi:hypothetical protein